LITVSTSYAEEIQEAELGFGLDGVVRANKHKLFGITNGIDQERWDPSKDEEIPFRYSRDNLEGKEKCKERLIQELSLERDIRKPLISMISRIVSQKGLRHTHTHNTGDIKPGVPACNTWKWRPKDNIHVENHGREIPIFLPLHRSL